MFISVESDEEIEKIISYRVRRFFDNGGRFDDKDGAETVRAADSTAGLTVGADTDQAQSAQTYSAEFTELLHTEYDDEVPYIRSTIRRARSSSFDINAVLDLAAGWLGINEFDKAAIAYREVLRHYPNHRQAQRVLKELQQERSTPTVKTSVQEDPAPAETTEHEDELSSVEISDSTETPQPEFSINLRRVLSRAEVLRKRLIQPHITREILFTSLFLTDEDSTARVVLSSFGVRAETLIARLCQLFGSDYPASLLADEFKNNAVELGSRYQLYARIVELRFDLVVESRSVEAEDALKALNALQVAELEPRHLFWTLMSGDTTGWIEETLGQRETACIKRLLAAKGFDAQITRDEVLAAAASDRLFGKPPAHRDSAAKDDLLGFKTHAGALVDIIEKEETRPPLVIGVYGPWGAGKSTFMGLVKQKLDERSEERARERAATQAAKSLKGRLRAALARPLLAGLILKKPPAAIPPLKVVTIEYDAWAYADTPKLWSGLIGKVAKELDAELGWYGRFAYLIKRHSRRLIAAIAVGLVPVALFALGLLARLLQTVAATHAAGAHLSNFLQQIGFGTLLGSNALSKVAGVAMPVASLLYALALQKRPVTDAVTALAARFDSAPAAGIVSRIQDEFKTALETKINPAEKPETDDTKKSRIRQRVEQNQLKIVVFIDELDRCPLERIVDILEAIKLFLAEDIFIVFLGVDTRVAAEAIRLHYKDVKNPDLPREYLEKIVQLPLRVPQADDLEIKTYLGSFMPGIAAEQPQNGDGAQALRQTMQARPQAATASSSAAPGTLDQVAVEDTGKDAPEPQLVAEPSASATDVSRLHRIPDPFPTNNDNANKQGDARKSPAGSGASAISSLPSLPDTKDEYDCIAVIAKEFLESNPRRIKRLLNTYRYVKILASVSGEDVGTKEWQVGMLAWLAFTMKWPAFMERAVGAAQAESEAEAASNGGAPPSTNTFLVKLLKDNAAREQQPTRQEIEKYLPLDAAAIKLHYQLAGNFLIENPRPYTDTRNDTDAPAPRQDQ
ncbi:MAG TPA: P-loop NTPase fold protein [Pyrinomonadaceae bacterium]|nr:P-loop NTPase fold protein [Pyrinomonadaceae bacterium]